MQYPLWAILFVVPTAAAVVFGYWSARTRMLDEQKQGIIQAETLRAEQEAAIERANQIRRLVEWNEAKLEKWRSPKAVIHAIREASRIVGINGGYSGWDKISGDLLFFFTQASDEDLRTLMAEFQATDLQQLPQSRARTMQVLGVFPEFIPERLHVVEKEARALIEKARDDSYLAASVQAEWAEKAFDKALAKPGDSSAEEGP